MGLAQPNNTAFYKHAVELSTFDRMDDFGNSDLRWCVLFEIDGFAVELCMQKSYRIPPDRLPACFLIWVLRRWWPLIDGHQLGFRRL